MPLYVCSAPADVLDDAQRQGIAEVITRVHCEVTGAPATFVHVIFDESKTAYSVFGTIRAGRSEQTKERLRREMARAVANVAGLEPHQVGVFTVDVPASWVMEGGALLPEPGEEEQWLAAHASQPARDGRPGT
jgi:phenylpyruvate tautomerase PptA (4-oxalocrotonate tautomerase family)